MPYHLYMASIWNKSKITLLGQRKSILNKDKCHTNRTQWYYEEVEKLTQDKIAAYAEYRSKRKAKSKDHYKQVRNEAQGKIKTIMWHH